MTKTFCALGKAITINDEILELAQENEIAVTEVSCRHFLTVHFVYNGGYKTVGEGIAGLTNEQLSEIVCEEIKKESRPLTEKEADKYKETGHVVHDSENQQGS